MCRIFVHARVSVAVGGEETPFPEVRFSERFVFMQHWCGWDTRMLTGFKYFLRCMPGCPRAQIIVNLVVALLSTFHRR